MSSNNNETDDTTTIGDPIEESNTTETEEERINSLTDQREELAVEFYEYHDDNDTWGHRMEISTDGVQITPNTISEISNQTIWSFVGVQNGKVMFEGRSQKLIN